MGGNRNLRTCPDCGAEISRRAAICLHCGREMTLSPWRMLTNVVRFVFWGSVFYTAMMGFVFWWSARVIGVSRG